MFKYWLEWSRQNATASFNERQYVKMMRKRTHTHLVHELRIAHILMLTCVSTYALICFMCVCVCTCTVCVFVGVLNVSV